MSYYNGYLLDTHVLLWLDSEPQRIPHAVMEALQRTESRIFVSAASIWEIAIKIALGKLTVNIPLAALIERNQFIELPVTAKYADFVTELPHHHGDPFDRMLIAQAHMESLVLVTADTLLSVYGVPILLIE